MKVGDIMNLGHGKEIVSLLVIVSMTAAAWAGQEAKEKDTWLAFSDGAAAAGEAAQSPPAGDPAAQTAEAVWPPGLLMEGLDGIGAGRPLEGLGFRMWGFLETSFTGRLTGGQNSLPGRAYDARRPNNLRLNQLQLTLERPYDNSKSFDFGMRIDGLFGGDAKLTHAAGLLDNAGDGNSDNWTDVVQAYGQLWFKAGPESGLEITFGKFLELAGSEVAEATYNALYSHSYIYSFAEPTTHTGGYAKYIFNSQLFGYLGVVEGWDVFKDNNDAPTYITGGGWSSKEQIGGHARTQVLLNIITGPEQPDNTSNFRTLADIVINHWWTDKLSESLNIDYLTEENVPGVGRAKAYGLAHYLTYIFSDYVSGTWRVEWFRDDGGARTGVDGSWFENTWGLGVTPFPRDRVLKNLLVRPELRWDFADKPAFGGDHKNQLTLTFDVIFKF